MWTVLLGLLLLTEQHRPIELRSHPAMCMAPCDMRASIRIEPNEQNRWWVLVLDGPMYRESWTQLEGDHAPITQPDVWFKHLPPGDYDVIAIIYRQAAKSEAWRETKRLTVYGAQ
jgi:hypothetical protein